MLSLSKPATINLIYSVLLREFLQLLVTRQLLLHFFTVNQHLPTSYCLYTRLLVDTFIVCATATTNEKKLATY